MRHLIFGAVLLFSLSASAVFFPQTDDIPLMDGLKLSPKNTVAFDTPAGQILSYTATTKKSPNDIKSFYHETLTALGWTRGKADTYTRGADSFQITFPTSGTVKFDITLSSAN